MNYAGIIAEYNPFHTGHGYQMVQTREILGENTTIIVVMSGHWTQQAYPSISTKWDRASMALEGGADLILELPTPWACSSAERFAQGAVFLLESTGIVNHLSFGSEVGELSTLKSLAEQLDHPDFSTLLQGILKTGVSFPKAREQALATLWAREQWVEGEQNTTLNKQKNPAQISTLLQRPNNILGLEYLRAIKKLQSPITPLTILRKGGGFHEIQPMGERTVKMPYHTSATDLRDKLRQTPQQKGEQTEGYLKNYLSEFAYSLLSQGEIPDFSLCERGILSRLYGMTVSDWEQLPDSGKGEGLPHRLSQIAQESATLEEFYGKSKTKRITHARLRRLVLWAYLGISVNTLEEVGGVPSYLRVLGFNEKGKQALRLMKKTASLPILTKTAQIKNLSSPCQNLFALEQRCTNLYGLCFPTPLSLGLEFLTSPVVKL